MGQYMRRAADAGLRGASAQVQGDRDYSFAAPSRPGVRALRSPAEVNQVAKRGTREGRMLFAPSWLRRQLACRKLCRAGGTFGLAMRSLDLKEALSSRDLANHVYKSQYQGYRSGGHSWMVPCQLPRPRTSLPSGDHLRGGIPSPRAGCGVVVERFIDYYDYYCYH